MLEPYLKITKRISEKLQQKHSVTPTEVRECFLNRIKGLLEDSRLDNRTDPPTMWFIAETDHGRFLKVVFIELTDGAYKLKTAYEPNDNEVKIYERHA
jgi:uncharacterized DUF497 family protein